MLCEIAFGFSKGWGNKEDKTSLCGVVRSMHPCAALRRACTRLPSNCLKLKPDMCDLVTMFSLDGFNHVFQTNLAVMQPQYLY